MLRLKGRELQHPRDDPRLRDGLPRRGGKREIAVRAALEAGFDEQVSRYLLHGAQHARVHDAAPGDLLLDFFAGSGTFGESALELDRNCILVDNNPEALQVMKSRFSDEDVQWHCLPALKVASDGQG